MKKFLVLVIIVMVSCFLATSVSAATDKDWTFSGLNGTLSTDGMKFTESSIETINSAVYNYDLNTKNIKVEITPHSCVNKLDNDAWIAVCFMGVPSMFSLEKQAQTPGFVALYFNYNGTFRIQLDGYMEDIFNGADSWRLLQKGTPMKVGQKNTIELKYDEPNGMYHILINGIQLDDNAQLGLVDEKTEAATVKPETIFPSGKAYVVVGSYTSAGTAASFTVNSINGKSLGGVPTSSKTSTPGKTSTASQSSTSVSASETSSSDTTTTETFAAETTTEISTTSTTKGGMAGSNDPENNNLWIFVVVAAVVVLAGAGTFVYLKILRPKR